MKNITLLKYGRVTAESAFAIFAFEAPRRSPDDPDCFDVYLVALEPSLPRGTWVVNRHIGDNGLVLMESRQLESDLPEKVEDLADAAANPIGALHLVARRVGELIERDAQAVDAGWVNRHPESEGWAIFNGDEIQRLDGAGVFGSDEAAVEFVFKRAIGGSRYHADAIRLHLDGGAP
jgi:hypothetical protein